MNEHPEDEISLTWPEIGSTDDVVIIGGRGHGLSTAYHLATCHGITNVAVLEQNYIGGGNSGRNTTIIRANYGIPESVRFYQRSIDLYARLEEETGRSIMRSTKGLLWLAHTEAGVRREQARAAVNRAFGAETDFVSPAEIAQICPEIDLNAGDGQYPVLGASYHVQAATARHDRVVWSLAEGAQREGVEIHQRTQVLGLQMEGDRVVGVQTNRGSISAVTVVCAVGGHVTHIASMTGVRLLIRTHPLQAFVTNRYANSFEPIVASSDLLFYASQTARGQMLIGAEIDPQPSFSYRSGHDFLSPCSFRTITVLPFLRDLRIMRQWTGVCDMSPDYSPIIGHTGVDGFLVTTGWGTWGFKGIPAGGEQLAELIAPFALDRFANDRTKADRGSAGTH
jgi:sarcosine oxidase subunit beta